MQVRVNEVTEIVVNECFKRGPYEVSLTLTNESPELFVRTKDGDHITIEGSLLEIEDLAEMIQKAVDQLASKVVQE